MARCAFLAWREKTRASRRVVEEGRRFHYSCCGLLRDTKQHIPAKTRVLIYPACLAAFARHRHGGRLYMKTLAGGDDDRWLAISPHHHPWWLLFVLSLHSLAAVPVLVSAALQCMLHACLAIPLVRRGEPCGRRTFVPASNQLFMLQAPNQTGMARLLPVQALDHFFYFFQTSSSPPF